MIHTKHPIGYRVSIHGRIFRLSGAGEIEVPQRENERGYPFVAIKLDGKWIQKSVHYLVARAFLPPKPSPKHHTRHLDGNPGNRCAFNLAWGTAKENAEDRDRHGRTVRGERIHNSRFTAEQVMAVRERYGTTTPGRTVLAARDLGCSAKVAGEILSGRRWAHLPIIEAPSTQEGAVRQFHGREQGQIIGIRLAQEILACDLRSATEVARKFNVCVGTVRRLRRGAHALSHRLSSLPAGIEAVGGTTGSK